MKESAEYQVHWACGGKRATEAYLDSAEVREAIHVTPTALQKWRMETDRECSCNAGASALHTSAIFCPRLGLTSSLLCFWQSTTRAPCEPSGCCCRRHDDNPARCGLCTQGDDEKASRKNFTDCPIKDYRPMIKSLITEPPYLDILVYSGDVDAQIPHTATEAWTSQLGVPLKAGGEWRPWSQPDDSGDPAVLGCTLLLFAQLVAGCTLCTLEFSLRAVSTNLADTTRYAHNFTYATVKGAGHMVPTFRPAAALEMLRRYITKRSLV